MVALSPILHSATNLPHWSIVASDDGSVPDGGVLSDVHVANDGGAVGNQGGGLAELRNEVVDRFDLLMSGERFVVSDVLGQFGALQFVFCIQKLAYGCPAL